MKKNGTAIAKMTSEFKAGIDRDVWVPACNGFEKPFISRNGRRLLYVWNSATRTHAYINLGTDIILSTEDAEAEGLSGLCG